MKSFKDETNLSHIQVHQNNSNILGVNYRPISAVNKRSEYHLKSGIKQNSSKVK